MGAGVREQQTDRERWSAYARGRVSDVTVCVYTSSVN